MKVKVYGDRCTGHGRCWTVAPDTFHPDDEGFNDKLDAVVEVAAGQEDVARDAALSCPENALEVLD